MPELPEVETIRRGLSPLLNERTITGVTVRQRGLRQPIPMHFEQSLVGREITRVDRRGKALLLRTDGQMTVLIHLGMTGQVTVRPHDTPFRKHDHVSLTLDSGDEITYNDARRFGVVTVFNNDDEGTVFAGMGPEPLSEDFSPETLKSTISGKRTPIKALLLDQGIVAGIGNIYASEALWRAGIRPNRAGKSLSESEMSPLVSGIKSVLYDSIEAGGSTLRDYRHADGTPGRFQELFDVYGRDGVPCHRHGCDGVIRKCTQSGRSSYFCPVCQI